MSRVAYIDVDDTLIRSVGTKRIPIVASVSYVRTLWESGVELYCWSAGGGDYARSSASELGIEGCFVAFLPKPNLMLDDQKPEDWPSFQHLSPSSVPQVANPKS